MKKAGFIFKLIAIVTLWTVVKADLLSQAVQVFIDSVSVDPVDGSIYVSWVPVDTSPDIGVEVSRGKFHDSLDPKHIPGVVLDTVLLSESLLYHDTLVDGSLRFEGYRVTGPNGGPSGYHKTIFLQAEYDSCNASINLNWSGYEGWDDMSEYRVFDYNSGSVLGSAQGNSYNVKNILPDQQYAFFVRAYAPGSKTSSSNRVEVKTDGPDWPARIVPGNATAEDNYMDINFIIDQAGQLTSYKLYKIDDENIPVDSVANFNNFVYSYRDNDFNPRHVQYYQLVALDGCYNEVVFSDTLKNIVLQAEEESDIINLFWGNGDLWQQENPDYHVLRNNETGGFNILGTSRGLSYRDDIGQVEKGIYSNVLCYRASISGKVDGIDYTNTSNIACIEIEPEIFVPLTFSPNNDGVNDIFIPEFSFIPHDFEMNIINRAGRTVFKSNNPSEGWTGSGEPQATYVFTIVLTRQDGKKIKKAGYVSLVR